MCGIAGIIGAKDEAAARALIAPLAHRGPDGIRIETVGGSTLAHARLSIIDLEHGWQPLHAAGSTVVGNGEIYNYLELIEEFGLTCETGSDFEPLLHLYAREGEKAFDRLRGMYAFCLVGHDGRTWLVRDPFGIKPLYFRQDAAGIAFASEPRSLRRAKPSLDPARVDQLLALNYTLDSGAGARPASIYEGVSRLPPSSALLFDGRRTAMRRMAPETPPPTPPASDEDAVIQFDRLLDDSVALHQRSDVPYGLFLSGGVDSSAIAAVMARQNQRPVTAFTCGFDAPGARDERAHAERVAKALNLDWRETLFGEEDFWRIAPLVAEALDDPTTDYATLPTFKLAEAAKGTLTVVLSGEGGDELFGGYGRYRRAMRPWWRGGRPAEPRVGARFLKRDGQNALKQWRATLDWSPGQSPLLTAQLRDLYTWLPGDLLIKLDRCLMAHGLEGRTPFLDKPLAAFALGLPDHFRIRDDQGKWIVRKWLERNCPAADPWAKKKGFTVPVADWIAPRAADLGARVAAVQGVAEACKPGAAMAVFTDERQASSRWPLLFYALWWSIHVGGATPAEAADVVLGRV